MFFQVLKTRKCRREVYGTSIVPTGENVPRHFPFNQFRPDSAVNRAEVLACPVVRAFLVHPEGVPGGRPEDLVLGNIVECDRDAEHGRERNQIGADVSVGKRAVVGAPVGIGRAHV